MQDQVNFGLIAGCLIWVPVAVWIVTLVGWMIEGEVDVVPGLAGLFLGVGIGAAALINQEPNVAPFLLFAALSIVVLFPFVRAVKDKRDLAKLDLEMMERAYEQLAEKPNNIGAIFKIARTLHSRGSAGQAVALAESALKGINPQLFEDEHRLLKQWRRGVSQDHAAPIKCLRCLAKNKAGSIYCYRCKAPVLLHYAKGHWVDPDLFRKLILVWVAAMTSIVGIPIAATALPTRVGSIVVAALLGASAVATWAAVRGRKRKAA